MADQKSQVDKYVEIFLALLMDVEALTGLDLALDAREIVHRAKHEGITFLIRTLSEFYAEILLSVERGHMTPMAGFKHGRSGPLPYFLKGLVSGLFDSDGTLKNTERASTYLGYIGQICTFMKKCEFPYTPEQEDEKIREFLAVEQELPLEIPRTPQNNNPLCFASELLRHVFKDFSITENPRHGPGAVANKERAQEKYDFIFSDRIDEQFCYDEWFYPTGWTERRDGSGCSVYSPLTDLLLNPEGSEQDVPPARGIFVNKDYRGPRYISAEPKELMWIQQALGRSIMSHLEKHKLTRGHVNFSDQRVNGSLALRASIDRRMATLDLKDASDRVSLALVRAIFPSNLVRKLESCRSNCAVLPGNIRVELRKFAPMGSACCFPVESVVFWALSVASIVELTGMEHENAAAHVYVYGDDIIVTRRYARAVIAVLERFNLRVNTKKSYLNGPFRESCGVDAIDGYNITPVKLRKPVPRSKADVSALISWVETSNQLFYAGFWRTADCLKQIVNGFCPTPYVPYQSGCFGVTGFASAYQISGTKLKWDKRLHCLKMKVRRVHVATDDWSFNNSGPSAPLHTLAKADQSDQLSYLVGRSEASTLLPGGTARGLLVLRRAFQRLS